MAHASNEITRLRTIVTQLSEAQTDAAGQLRFIELLGGVKFVQPYLVDDAGEPTTDITLEEFLAGVSALDAVLSGITAEQAAAIAKLRS